MCNRVNVGDRYGMLVVESVSGNEATCRCDCGNVVVTKLWRLYTNHKKSCGCMRKKTANLENQRFGELVVLHKVPEKSYGHVCYLCQCDCGNTSVVTGLNLIHGITKSCGCRNEKRKAVFGSVVKHHTKHNLITKDAPHEHTRLYNIWRGMMSRCYNTEAHDYGNYGGRGIAVCTEWLASPTVFVDWALANGYADNLTLDRVCNYKGYEPDNCRWVTMKANIRNGRRARRYLGRTIMEWAELLFDNPQEAYGRIKSRLCLGWNDHAAIFAPVGIKYKPIG